MLRSGSSKPAINRPFSKAAAGTSSSDYEDKYRRANEENTQLKKERNELEEKVKDLKTKFRRLTRDLVPDENGDYLINAGAVGKGQTMAGHTNTSITATVGAGTAAKPSSTSFASRKASMGDSLISVGAHASLHHPLANPAVENLRVHFIEEEKRRLEEKLKFAQQQIDYFTLEMNRMKTSTPAGESASQLVSQLQLLQQQLEGARTTKANDGQRIASLQRERDILHADVQNLTNQLKSSEAGKSHQQGLASSAAANAVSTEHYRRQVQDLMVDLQKNRDQQLADLQTIDTLTRERDRLKVQASLAGSGATHNPNNLSQLPQGATAVDSQSLNELQRSLAEKGTQITVLTNRMNFAQGQAEAMRTECERLVDELKSLNQQHSEVKRNMFQLEHEKASLVLRCEKVATLESTVDLKTQELIRSEQELLRCVDRLQSCSRDTELQVRKELGERMSEVEGMRDKAEADRRANEREVLAARLETSDFKRRFENALHDTELYKREVQRLDAEKKELMDRAAMAGVGGFSAALNVDDDVHRAVALATMRKRAAGGLPLSGASNAASSPSLSTMLGGANNGQSNATANEVMAMWEGMEWSDGKELSMLRETLAATAVDMELADTRCTQLQQALNSKKDLLEGVSSERDELLTENIELRHRISGVQTALARAQLQKLTIAQNAHNASAKTSLVLALNSIQCDPVYQQCDDGSTYTPTLFFTLDLEGIEGYEPILSETFFSLNSNLSVQFVFNDIDPQEVTMARLQKSNFVLQLHQSFGTESCIVATATLNGARLLNCRYDGVHSDHLPLFTLEGERMGSVDVTVTAPDLLLPIFLARPLVSAITPDSIRAALIAFRSVRGLRIQVFKANNLANNSQTLAAPSPYVFYTSTSPHGVTFIADTMVTTSSRMVTNNPTFEPLPTDHSVVLDPEFVRFMSDGCLTFVIFDHKASDIRDNIGLAVFSLREMLASPTTVIQRTESLHPQGSIEIGISWIRSSE